MRELKLGFGGITISLIFEEDNPIFKLEEPYQHFISDEKRDVACRVHLGKIPELQPEETVFDTEENWSMLRYNAGYILKASGRVLALDSDFRSGDLYIDPFESPPSPLSYPLDEVLIISLLAKGRGLIVHACGVNDGNEGSLFIGTSGAGKSTIANLWRSKKDAVILSDDRIIIRKMGGHFGIYGTPWHGDAKACSPERAPLKKIFFLKHADKNKIKKLSPIDATSRMIVRSFPTFWDKKGMEFTLGFIDELVTEVPCYELGFLHNERIIDFVRNI
jgi:hypothetical protein